MYNLTNTGNMLSLIYQSSYDAKSELLNENIGVTVLRLVGEGLETAVIRKLLLEECCHDMEQAPVVKSVHQDFSQKRVFRQTELMAAFKEKLEEVIFKEIYEKHNLVPAKGLRFELPNLQMYEYVESDTPFAIPPHVDYKACVEVIAIVLLEGDSQLYVAEDRECHNERLVDAKPLDIILLRGYQFQGVEKRPIHYVKKIKKGARRVSLGFRMLGDNQTDIDTMERELHSP